VATQQSFRVLAKGRVAAALAAIAFDATGVAALAAEFRDQLPVLALERSRVQNVGHAGTISSALPKRQAFSKRCEYPVLRGERT
jgi:hypothetical protein